MRTTHTYAVLKVSPATYDEIARLLRDEIQEHAFVKEIGGEVYIDMNGIGLERGEEPVGPSPIREALNAGAGILQIKDET
jgi:hypothetical protein